MCPVAGKMTPASRFLGHWLFGLNNLGRWAARLSCARRGIARTPDAERSQ
jgi:hypothetical protein